MGKGNKTNKEILISLVATLSDDECRDVYNFITWTEYKPEKKVVEGIELTPKQYNKLLYLWGEDKLTKCCKLLAEWIESKGDKITVKFSPYRQLVGWVERKYQQIYPQGVKEQGTNYGSIDTVYKAINYIKSLPKAIRLYDPDVRFIIEKYKINLDKYLKD